MEKYDLAIIGGGAAGFAAATRADELRLKTALINSGLPMGGTCVNVGCVPSKHFLALGKELHAIAHPKFNSVSSDKPQFDYEKARQEKEALLDALRKKNYQDVLGSFENVSWFDGKGVLESARVIKVDDKKIEAEKILIATGCSAFVPPIAGLSEAGYLTNIEALSLTKQPASLVILGGGALGLEFAQIFSRMGTKVTVLKRGERILTQQEPEISVYLRKYLEDEGINIITGVRVLGVKKSGNNKEVIFEQDGKSEKIVAESILAATGVSANIKGLGLEKVGIKTEGGHHIIVDDFLRTNIPNIYAAGDCVFHRCLETVAAKEGKIAVENAFEDARKTVDFSSVPYAVFTDPEVAGVGLTEAEYLGKYNTCTCRTVYLDRVPKALAVNDTRGLIKMVAHHQTGKIMGVHLLAPTASEMIHEAVLAVKFGLTVDDIIDTVHVFPTYSEAIKIAAQAFRRDISTMSCCVE